MAQSPSSPICVSIQPGQHLCVDSRPGTSAQLPSESRAQFACFDQFRSRPTTHYISSPFKQGRQTRSSDSKMIDPSSGLKQITKNSLKLARNDYKVSLHTYEDIDMKNKTFYTRQRQGRLLPLLGPPLVKGPVINQCVGITSGQYSTVKNNRRIKRRFESGNRDRISIESRGQNRLSFLHRESSIHRNSFNSLHHEETDGSSHSGNDSNECVTSEDERNNHHHDHEVIERVSRLNFVG